MTVGARTVGARTMRMAMIVDRFVVMNVIVGMSVASGMGHGKRLCCTGIAEGTASARKCYNIT